MAQCLRKIYNRPPYYWSSNGKSEVDFVIEHDGLIIPIEVKSGNNLKAKSLKIFKEKYHPKIQIKVSNRNVNLNNGILNIPLFFAGDFDKFIKKVIIKFPDLF